jgi:hypothetical protein
LFLFFGGTGVWTQGFALAKQVLYWLSHTWPPHFALVTLKMESHELFAWSGFEPWSSWSQPLK